MPPVALRDIAPVVRGHCNTMQNRRKRTRGHYIDQQIREALHARMRLPDIAPNDRRYRSQLKSLNP